MMAFIVTFGIGVLILVLGIINMTGNISSLHWYHRQRVTEENRKPYGRLIGCGTGLVGIACAVYGVLMLVFERTGNAGYLTFATAQLIVGIAVGIVITVIAMIKYNKGIF